MSSSTTSEDEAQDETYDASNTNAARQDIELEETIRSTGLASSLTAIDDDVHVPIIDLSLGSNNSIAEQLLDAAKEVGFFTVIGHGIPQETIDSAFRVSEEFFAMPIKDKEQQCPFSAPFNSGFEHMKQIRPSTGLADQKESFHITAREGCMDNRWPKKKKKNDDFKTHMIEFMEAANSLSGHILNLLESEAVPNVEAGTLARSHTLWGEHGQVCLRLLHYPAVPEEDIDELRKAGYWRCGAHTDWTNLSLLFQRPGQDGLECCANPRGKSTTKKWIAVPPVEGGIAVNIGDMLARWSDGRLHSNLHRVRLPRQEEMNPPKARYSIGYFAQSDRNVVMESTNADPITAGDYIAMRIKANFC